MQVALEDKDGLTPLMHGLLAVRSSMDSESAVRAVSVLAQHSKPGSLQAQQDGVGAQQCLYNSVYLPNETNCNRMPPSCGRISSKLWSRAGLPADPS